MGELVLAARISCTSAVCNEKDFSFLINDVLTGATTTIAHSVSRIPWSWARQLR